MTTDKTNTFNQGSINLIGSDMAKSAALKVYKQIGLAPSEVPNKVDVCELHDCFAANELCVYEALGFCPTGKAGEAIDRGDFTYGGKIVVNASGGLISKGHPLGATGLAQCAELCWQVQGRADKRQVPNAKLALQHNLGLGGACIVAAYQKYNTNQAKPKERMTSNPDALDDYEKNNPKSKPLPSKQARL